MKGVFSAKGQKTLDLLTQAGPWPTSCLKRCAKECPDASFWFEFRRRRRSGATAGEVFCLCRRNKARRRYFFGNGSEPGPAREKQTADSEKQHKGGPLGMLLPAKWTLGEVHAVPGRGRRAVFARNYSNTSISRSKKAIDLIFGSAESSWNFPRFESGLASLESILRWLWSKE